MTVDAVPWGAVQSHPPHTMRIFQAAAISTILRQLWDAVACYTQALDCLALANAPAKPALADPAAWSALALPAAAPGAPKRRRKVAAAPARAARPKRAASKGAGKTCKKPRSR